MVKKIATIPEFRGSLGLCTGIICSSLTRKEVEDRCNEKNPTGISSRWQVQGRARKCPDHPGTHKHFALVC